MPVLFRKYDVDRVVSPEGLATIHQRSERSRHPSRFGLVFEGVGEDAKSNPLRHMPVLDRTPGKAVCVSTEISERKDFPDVNGACYYLQVEVAFILSHAGGCVRHHATVVQNVIGPAKSGVRSFTQGDSKGAASKALKARLKAIERKLRRIDLSGLRLPRVVNTVRSDVWNYDQPPGGKEDGLYSVKVSYLN